ncbi:MAG: DUF2085 domain-containing protein [Anaerolineales bacterium]|nr:DUF2085 domain-containing protein [Anaerolineales bacterium]
MTNAILKEKLTQQNLKLIRRKRFQMRLLENWWVVAVLILGIYVGLPISAPFLMKAGLNGPANGIYTTYSFMCHQFAFRSIFLFGDQTVYPRAETGTNLITFEEEAAKSKAFEEVYLKQRAKENEFSGEFSTAEYGEWSRTLQFAARSFQGDEVFGYKMALCQRDIAIYAAMVVAGIFYGLFRRRIRPAPLWLYVMLGLAPIGLDGFSQLLGYPPFSLWEPRETQPFFRILTGTLFGVMNVWVAFPYINISMQESAKQIRRALKRIDDEIAKLG